LLAKHSLKWANCIKSAKNVLFSDWVFYHWLQDFSDVK
jgi:hypothetical protein